MKDFTYGEMMIVSLALLSMLKDVDATLEVGTALQEMIGKVEMSLKTLRAAAADQLPESLAPDSPLKK